MKRAIYAFSGDPITYGHLDIIERASKIFDELVVGIGVNPGKKYLFTLEERTRMAQQAVSNLKNVKVVSFQGLLVDFAYENDISVIIRGLRNGDDFNYEVMLHQIGESQALQIDTFFLPCKQEFAHISSGASKALELEQGLIHGYVPLNVKQKMEEKLSQQYILAVTGEIGVGKSFLSKDLIYYCLQMGISAHQIDIDTIGHEILESLKEPIYVRIREEIVSLFGSEIQTENGFIDRKKLGKIIFADLNKLQQFNQIIYKPLLMRLRRELRGKQGLIIIDSALISESNMAYLSNNNVVLVQNSKENQRDNLTKRGYTQEQIESRISSQFTFERKKEFLQLQIEKDSYGKIFEVNLCNDNSKELIEKILTYFNIPKSN